MRINSFALFVIQLATDACPNMWESLCGEQQEVNISLNRAFDLLHPRALEVLGFKTHPRVLFESKSTDLDALLCAEGEELAEIPTIDNLDNILRINMGEALLAFTARADMICGREES